MIFINNTKETGGWKNVMPENRGDLTTKTKEEMNIS